MKSWDTCAQWLKSHYADVNNLLVMYGLVSLMKLADNPFYRIVEAPVLQGLSCPKLKILR